MRDASNLLYFNFEDERLGEMEVGQLRASLGDGGLFLGERDVDFERTGCVARLEFGESRVAWGPAVSDGRVNLPCEVNDRDIGLAGAPLTCRAVVVALK